MPFPTFSALLGQFFQHFQHQEYAQALALMAQEGPRFPNDRMMATYLHMCAAARVGDRPLVYGLASQILAEGKWYSENLWRQSPSFAALQGDLEFERLVAASQNIQAGDLPPASPLILLPENPTPESPLLIALHRNQAMAADTLPFWQAAVSRGWGLALPQSTQPVHTGAYEWDNLEQSIASIRADFAHLQQTTPFDPRHVIIAGHSMGGLVAIQIALRGLLDVRGFIVNGPAVPFLDTPEELETLLPGARARNLRGYFILGTQDDNIFGDKVEALANTLQTAGLACELETVPGATHDYSPAYDAALLRGLAWCSHPVGAVG